MTARRARRPTERASVEVDLSYFMTARPVGLLLSTVAGMYERAFLKGLRADKSFASITPADHSLLRCVAQGSATSSDIARTMGLSKQATGKTISSLERRGFVVRSRSDADLRAQIVSLTNGKGRRLVEHSIRVAKALDLRTLEILGEDDLALLKVLVVRIQDAGDRLTQDP